MCRRPGAEGECLRCAGHDYDDDQFLYDIVHDLYHSAAGDDDYHGADNNKLGCTDHNHDCTAADHYDNPGTADNSPAVW